MKKFKKILIRTVLIIVAIIILLLIFIQTRPFKNFIRVLIVKNINKNLHEADFMMGRIEGNFFSHLSLKDIKIENEKETIIEITSIDLKYSLGAVFTKNITIEHILLAESNIILSQGEENLWNLQKIFPEKAAPESKTGKEPSPSPSWTIHLKDFSLQNCNIAIITRNENHVIPSRIKDLNINFKAVYSPDFILFQLSHFKFETENPQFILKNIYLKALLENQQFTLDTLKFETAKNSLTGEARFDLQEKRLKNLHLSMQPLDLDEFKPFLSELPLKKFPKIFIDTQIDQNKAVARLEIEQTDQKINLSIQADSIYQLPVYQGSLKISRLDLSSWLNDANLKSDLNLVLSASGTGLEPETLRIDLKMIMENSSLNNYQVDSLNSTINKFKDQAILVSDLGGEFGRIILNGNIKRLFSKPEYDIQGIFQTVNLAVLLQDSLFNSDLNLSFNLSGSGTDLEALVTDLNLASSKSKFGEIELDSLLISLNYNKGNYQINDFKFFNDIIKITVHGSGDITGDNELNYQILINDLTPLKKFIPEYELSAKGKITGSLKGKMDDFSTDTEIDLDMIRFNDIYLDNLHCQLSGHKQKTALNGNVRLLLKDLKKGELSFNEIEVMVTGNQDSLTSSLTIISDTLQIQLESEIIRDSIITLRLPLLAIKYGSLDWKTTGNELKIIIEPECYRIEDLILSNHDSQLAVNGFFCRDSTLNIFCSLKDFDLSLINNFDLSPYPVAGNLDLDLAANGSISEPELNSRLEIRDLNINDLFFDHVNFSLDLKEELLNTDFEIVKTSVERLYGSASIPFSMKGNSEQGYIDRSAPLEITVNVDDLDISFLENFVGSIENIEGKFNVDLKLSNTLDDPKLSGHVKLSEGKLKFPEYGLDYPELRMNASFVNRDINLEEIYLKGGDGYLKLTGDAFLPDTLLAFPDSFQFKLKADKFMAAGRRDIFLLTDMDIDLFGNPRITNFNGTISIPKSRWDLDKLQKSKRNKKDINQPLLVQALQQIKNGDTTVVTKKKKSPEILNQLYGSLKIKIPRNTWIRNKDMNIEISGDLEVIKHGKDFEIFGYVKPIRGKYEIYGKKFDMAGGILTFNGGKEINPYLDISVKNSFRDINRNRRLLTIKLTERALNPKIVFLLDEEEITEVDAISYLLFGKSNDQITQGEVSQVNEQSESSPTKLFLARQIGSRITQEIGKTLNFDVVEFSGGENWKKASILVGKYITNDFFLSYQREFSLSQSKEIVPDKVSLEYELSRFFSIQATHGNEKATGFDLFWKFERK